jgi:hypothetical protein
MGGGLMQLVAYGAQDIYLTGNPQITFFKVVYRRHTNFSMEAVAQTFSGSQNYGSKVTATIARNGDLIHKMYLEWNPLAMLNSGNVNGLCPNVGHTLINEIELEIGGQKIDKHYGHWLQTWSELTEVNPTGAISAVTAAGVEPATGTTLGRRMSYNHVGIEATTVNNAPANAHIPLQFWFCRNPGLALPLIALQYHEVKVSVTYLANSNQLVETVAGLPGGGTFSPMTLYVDYIYLDTDERRRFAQQSHEYLIEQLQYQQQGSGTATRTELNFNHPVKELIWTGVPRTSVKVTGTSANEVNCSPATPATLGTIGTRTGVATTDTFCLKLNGHERFTPRHLHYFTRAQVHQHHSGFGGVTQRDSIAVYSFALKPEEHQPSGTCNFSRIDNAVIEHSAHPAVFAVNATFDGRNAGLNIYAVNYNVLRIMSGMGGLAYSN